MNRQIVAERATLCSRRSCTTGEVSGRIRGASKDIDAKRRASSVPRGPCHPPVLRQNQHDQRFLHRVKPVSFGNVVAPVLSYLIRFRQKLGHRLAFPDAVHFEFMGNVWSHRN